MRLPRSVPEEGQRTRHFRIIADRTRGFNKKVEASQWDR